MRKKSIYKVHCDIKPHPKPHEISAAGLVADFLRANVIFIESSNSLKTPDLLIKNQRWEMKSPLGGGSKTVMHQFQRASRQSMYMIFDARRIKMHPNKCLAHTLAQFRDAKNIKRLIYISKDGSVSELTK